MKINVHAGHTSQTGKACGACGIVKESVEDRRIAYAVIQILRDRGHTVYDCTSEGSSARDNLYKIVEKCNAHNVDLDVSIHLNCYNGKAQGTETLIYSSNSKAKTAAKRITNNMAALGFANRGVKVRPDLYVLHRTKAPALLVETFFCDSKKDCLIYHTKGYMKLAEAIADGITTKTVKQKIKDKVTKKNSIGKSNEEVAREVIKGKWGNYPERKRRLEAAGYNYSAVQKIVNKILKG